MKIGSSATRLPISNIVAKGTCPICAALKEFQNYFATNLRASECFHFCNLHAWVIANSAPAESAATAFLESMRNPLWVPSMPSPSDCDFCKRMEIEKQTRMTEIIEELDRPALRGWLHEHGMLCFRHGHELIHKIPEQLRHTVEDTMSRKARELEQELQEFLQHAKTGITLVVEYSGGRQNT
ncbi:MAG: hypothetical protein WB630_20080 [Candidatus Acidiferrales bacterium]